MWLFCNQTLTDSQPLTFRGALVGPEAMPEKTKIVTKPMSLSSGKKRGKVRLEVYGEEMVEKVVRLSGNTCRVNLPVDWVGRRVKVIRLD